jgi:hypothetical protein
MMSKGIVLGAALCLVSCSEQQPAGPSLPAPSQSASAASGAAGAGQPQVKMGPTVGVEETFSSGAQRDCVLDALKVCQAYEPVGPAGSDARTVSIEIPSGPTISVRCSYSGAGGALSAAAPQGTVPRDPDSQSFLAAHKLCAARPDPPG